MADMEPADYRAATFGTKPFNVQLQSDDAEAVAFGVKGGSTAIQRSSGDPLPTTSETYDTPSAAANTSGQARTIASELQRSIHDSS